MSRYPSPYSQPQTLDYGTSAGVVARFMNNVYAWMAAGLALTAVVAWMVAHNASALATILNPGTFILLVLIQFALVMFIGYATERVNAGVATALFLLYAAMNGLLFSVIFLTYSLGSIGFAFAITAGMFGGMSVIGYVTKMDLTSFRGFFIMGLIGIVIASVINIFLNSTPLYWILTYATVALFLGLTAYDTQKLKEIAYATEGNPHLANRLAIIGALKLYLDFINLFLMILRILGNRRS
jgi:FtsH-binding integral membrane protein